MWISLCSRLNCQLPPFEDANGVRWAQDENCTIHRFSAPSNGRTHWNGSTGGDKNLFAIESEPPVPEAPASTNSSLPKTYPLK